MSDFDDPTVIASTHPSAASFRGRLTLIEVTGFEFQIPNPDQPGKFHDRITATVTTVDGGGQVQVFSRHVPTGVFLEGPTHKGVWFSQGRLVEHLAPRGAADIGRKVLGIIQTYKPGKAPGIGNPWGLLAATPEEKQVARDFLAKHAVAAAAAPAPDDASDRADDPWARTATDAPF